MRVFVYGTLKRGYGNHTVMQDAEGIYITNAVIKGTMYDLGTFPGVRLEGEGKIYGEIYYVGSQEGINRLDRLEGHPGFYKRREIDSSAGLVNVYEINSRYIDKLPVIVGGMW